MGRRRGSPIRRHRPDSFRIERRSDPPALAVPSEARAGNFGYIPPPAPDNTGSDPVADGAAWTRMKTYLCIVCGFVYDEALGLPDEGIAAGTLWADIPEDWMCPDCGVAKADFEMVEV